ncbi:MAG TPA: energy transducer TonB [Flavobacteriales bacterium]|nr:energy transducer TonB [Flavobacteriales bacterium]
MEPKKSPRANLNNYSNTFLLIGLVVVLFASWRLIELKTYEKAIDIGKLDLQGDEEDQTLEVNVEDIKLPPPPQQVAPPEEIEVVEDEKDVKEDVVASTETDDKEEIQDVEDLNTEEVEEPEVEVAFQFIQNPPIYPGCEGKKGQALKDCMSKKIQKFVNRNFNTDIASDLGLSGERIRILTMFTIGTDGRVTNIRARSKYKDLEKEAKRVISKLPRMKPGQQRNRPVKVTYTLPIIFKVEE